MTCLEDSPGPWWRVVKPYWWILTILVLLVVVLALRVTVWRTPPSSDCISSVVIVRGPRGERVECVCMGGTISTCFDPGP